MAFAAGSAAAETVLAGSGAGALVREVHPTTPTTSKLMRIARRSEGLHRTVPSVAVTDRLPTRAGVEPVGKIGAPRPRHVRHIVP
jgi:hypothetical protein